MYDVPRLGVPFVPRGLRDVALVLDEFTPTRYDAWLGRALAPLPALPSPLSGGGRFADGEVPARAVVVRHSGDVAGRVPAFGRRRSRLAAVLDVTPPPAPLLGVVVEDSGVSLLWLPDRDPATLARDLSRADWRLFLDW
jgi:hypothetical protein